MAWTAEQIDELFRDSPPPQEQQSNGHDLTEQKFRTREAGVQDYRIQLLNNARFQKEHESGITRDQVEAAILEARTFPDSGVGPPPFLEMDEEEFRGLLSSVLTELYPIQLPSTRPGAGPPADPSQLYVDRMAIDAYEAHHIMVTDQRGYSVAGLLKQGCTMIVAGLMGSGKTTLATNLVRSWALGETFLGRDVIKANTLVVVSPKEYEAWAEIIGFWGIRGQIFLVESTKAHFKKPEETLQWFAYLMDKHSCSSFVLDTLFDFYGMPPNNSGDQNRIVMNEQSPLLQMVRERMWSGLVTGHPPKSEAQSQTPRDPEEAFGGHTAWTAQHRMRMVLRRNSGASGIITGKGGYGDEGILKEEMLLFDADTRLVSLGGPFANYLGQVAMAPVVDAISGWMSRAEIEKKLGKRKEWILAGLKAALKKGLVKPNGKKGRSAKYALSDEPGEQEDLF